ncbi:TolC family protein [Paraburkholderia youngii]|uniref:TolC family protein n=1 Tax=Paraburkholderia youngii TaxID=2782701 RepID=UPI0034A1BEDF
MSKYSWNNQPTTLQLGVPQFPANGREWYLGFQLTIAIFEGFTRTYQIHEAEARTDLQRYALDEVEQQVGLDVWTSYQALKAATDNLSNTAMLLDVAHRSYEASQHRYQVGVGNILELLNAQSSLATAKRQRIQSLTDWRPPGFSLRRNLAGFECPMSEMELRNRCNETAFLSNASISHLDLPDIGAARESLRRGRTERGLSSLSSWGCDGYSGLTPAFNQ